MSDTFNQLRGSFNTQYAENEDNKKRGFEQRYPKQDKRKEFTPLKSETSNQFKQGKLDKLLDSKQYDKMDARDLLLFFKNCVETTGNKCPITLHGKDHNLMKTIMQKYGSYIVYTAINFLFEAEHDFINKRVISLSYVSCNIQWLQAYADMYEKGEDWTVLLRKHKPNKKVESTRESKFDKVRETGEWE